MAEKYNVIELKEDSIEVVNEQCLRLNNIKWKFRSELYGRKGALKIIDKEKEFNNDSIFGHSGATTGVFGSHIRVVFIIDVNKVIFNTDTDNLDDILIDGTDGIYNSWDLINELKKYAIKSFKIGFSQWTEAAGMASMFYKYDFATKEMKQELIEQNDAIIRVINSGHYLRDEIFLIAKEFGFKVEEMNFEDWFLDSVKESSDYDLEVALYRPIYDLSCSDPIILAPEWW